MRLGSVYGWRAYLSDSASCLVSVGEFTAGRPGRAETLCDCFLPLEFGSRSSE